MGSSACKSASHAKRFVAIRLWRNCNCSSCASLCWLLLSSPNLCLLSLFLVPLPLPLLVDRLPTILGVVLSSQKSDAHTIIAFVCRLTAARIIAYNACEHNSIVLNRQHSLAC